MALTTGPLELAQVDNRAPTPSSPGSTSGESLSGIESSAGEQSAGVQDVDVMDQVVDVATQAPGQRGTSVHSTSTVTGSRRRHLHHRHSLALGTGSAKMGSSITDSAQSTEDEMYDKEADEDDANNDEPQVYYPALATPTASSKAYWPFGVAGGSISAISGAPAFIQPGSTNEPSSASTVSSPTSPDIREEGPPTMDYQSLFPRRQSSASAAHLPHEILLKILKNVRSSPDLVSALRVCKSWCQCGVELLWNKPLFPHVGPLIKMLVALSRPTSTFPYASFIKRLNFSQLADRMSDALLMRLTVCDRLERLTLAGCSEVSDEALTLLLQSCKNLVALDMSDCVRITDATVDMVASNCHRLQGLNLSGCKLVTDKGVQALAKGCPMLRRVKLRNLEHLTDSAVIALGLSCPLLLEVDLYACFSITDRTLWALLRNSSHLRELSLNNCAQVTSDGFPAREGSMLYLKGSEDPDLKGKRYLNTKYHHLLQKKKTDLPDYLSHLLETTPLAPKMFEHVRYLDLTGLSHLNDGALEGIVSTMPHIRNLVLAKCVNLTDDSIMSICRLGKHIHFLHLGHVSSLTDKAVTALARSCTRLRYIDLACCPLLTDLSVFELAGNLPRLKRIGLVRVANLTDQAMFALSDRTTLERIHLSYCENITIPAIQFLLSRLHLLNHLSLTGVPAFKRADLQHFCRAPPKDFNSHQRSTFCVYSGKGVQELRKHLIALQHQANIGHISSNNGLLISGPTGSASGHTNGNPHHHTQHHQDVDTSFQSQDDEAEMYDEADEEDDGEDESRDEDTEDDRGTRVHVANTSRASQQHSHTRGQGHNHNRTHTQGHNHSHRHRQHAHIQTQPSTSASTNPSTLFPGPHFRPNPRLDAMSTGPSASTSAQVDLGPSIAPGGAMTGSAYSAFNSLRSQFSYGSTNGTGNFGTSLGTPIQATWSNEPFQPNRHSNTNPSRDFGRIHQPLFQQSPAQGVRANYLDTAVSPTTQTPPQGSFHGNVNGSNGPGAFGGQYGTTPTLTATPDHDEDGDRRMRSVSVDAESRHSMEIEPRGARTRRDTINQSNYRSEQ